MCISKIKAQTPFNKVYDLDAKYVQLRGDVIFEYKDKIYTAGASFETDDTIYNEVNFYVASFDQLGEPINDIIWYNDLNPFNNSLFYNNEEVLYNNEIFFAVETSFSDTQCVVKVNESLTHLEEQACYSDSSSVLLNPYSFVEFPNGNLTVVLGNEQPKIDLLLAKIDLTEKDNWSISNPSVEEFSYYPYKILRFPDQDDRALIMGVYFQFMNGFARDTTNLYGMFMMVIDEDHNVIESKYLYNNVTTTGPGFDAVINDDGSVVFTMMTFDRELWNETFDAVFKPVVAKLNPDLSVAWIKPFGVSEYTSRPEQLASVIKSHNNDGYIIGGLSFWDNHGMIGKVNNNGDSLWRYVVTSLYEENSNFLKDVTKSSDGNYLASGERFIRTMDDSINSNLQLWIIKFDDNGQIVDVGTTSTADEPESINGITVYPNPTADVVYIKQDDEQSLRYNLYDAHGRLLQSQQESGGQRILILDIHNYSSGIYYLKVIDDTGKQLYTHKISVAR
jgi:hypothetical protein